MKHGAPARISFDLPDEAQRISPQEALDVQLYEIAEGKCEIQVYYLYGYHRADAVFLLTGKEEQQLGLLQTQRDGRSEYRFSWIGQEDTPRRYTCALVPEATTVYALVVSTEVKPSSEMKALRQRVLESFSICCEP